MVVIGSDAVNSFTRLCIEEELIKPLALGAGSDAYRLLSASKDGQNYLFQHGRLYRRCTTTAIIGC